jgi:ethanolamine utilization microcompartment shell protein EutL
MAALYAGAAHGPSPTAGEVLIMLAARTRRKFAPGWMR